MYALDTKTPIAYFSFFLPLSNLARLTIAQRINGGCAAFFYKAVWSSLLSPASSKVKYGKQ